MAEEIPEISTPDNDGPDSPLDMSDEDFLKLETPADEQPTDLGDDAGSATGDQPDPQPGADDAGQDPEQDVGDPDNATDAPGLPPADEPAGDGEPAQPASSDAVSPGDDPNAEPEPKAETDGADVPDSPEKVLQQNGEVDFADIGKKVMAEFKANGQSMKMKSAEDVVRLMQMGVNYTEKMTGLKPSLRTLKLLEKHGLVDPEKINFLIDLSNKKPEAIAKLLKDSGIDPMDIDVKADNNYVPEKREVSDTELQLDEVLSNIKGSQHYGRTLNVLSQDWDESSRKAISENPQIIQVINEHMEKGLYEQVASAVQYQRNIGKLAGVSDFEAYRQMGDHMNANNLFVTSASATDSPATVSTPAPVIVSNTTTNPSAAETERLARKKAATSTTATPSKKTDTKDYDPLGMSDEDFLKFDKTFV